MRYISAVLITLLSLALGASNQYFPFSGGLIVGKYLAGTDYNDTNVLGIFTEYKFLETVSIGLEHRVFPIETNIESSLTPDYDVSLTGIYFNKYKSLSKYVRSNPNMSAYTSIGAASITVNNDDKIYIMLAIGLRLSPADKLMVDFTIKDYMKEFSIPFTRFPDIDIAAVGGGKHYLNLSLGISLSFGSPNQ